RGEPRRHDGRRHARALNLQRGIEMPCLRINFCSIWRDTFERAAARAMLPCARESTVSRYFSSNAVVAFRRAARSGSIQDLLPSAEGGGELQVRDAGAG